MLLSALLFYIFKSTQNQKRVVQFSQLQPYNEIIKEKEAVIMNAVKIHNKHLQYFLRNRALKVISVEFAIIICTLTKLTNKIGV